MKIACCTVIKSENGIDAYYVDMALKSLMPYVCGIYVQNQGCTDNAIDVIKQTIGNEVPLVIDEFQTGLPRFHMDYNEPLYRNKAIERCEEEFDPDWMVQCDADDIFTPYLFEQVDKLQDNGELDRYNGILYASDRFITPEYKSNCPDDKRDQR